MRNVTYNCVLNNVLVVGSRIPVGGSLKLMVSLLIVFFILLFFSFVFPLPSSISGVAYSKHIVHIYSYHGGDDLRNHLEVCFSFEVHTCDN